MEEKIRKATLMQMQVSLPNKIIISAAVMAVLISVVYFVNIPNPNMVLIAGLVFCSALFGYGGGVVSAVIMLFYTLYFFSTDNSFVNFTDENIRKVIVSLVGIMADMIFVCQLKKAEVEAFREVEVLTQELKKENEYLQSISITDALTGIRNRLALRQDYDSYAGREVTVMMLDLDKFKMINDTYGHKEGDRILKETADILADTFGMEHCYRYGGDEFIVILPDEDEAVFRKKVNEMMSRRPEIDADGKKEMADFSVGYVHEKLSDNDRLRKLFSTADEKMYEIKTGKRKNDI